MWLVASEIENKTTASHILCSKFAVVILLLFHILAQDTGVTAELTCHQCRGINCLRTSYEVTQTCLNDLDICVNVFDGQTLLAQGCWEQLPKELRNKCDRECFKCNENLCNNFSSNSFECIQCDSDSDENCRSNPFSLTPSRCGISRTRKSNLLHILCSKFAVVILLLFHILAQDTGVTAELTCHQCRGINCLRTSYEVTQTCLNDLDICVNVFDGQTLLAQGCWEQLPKELRNKCDRECFKCNENLCNNFSSNSFECIQCDSDSDENCRSNPFSLTPSRCGISRTPNEYCFVKHEGERVIRGCSNTLEAQVSCLKSANCMICQPSELSGCNNIAITIDDSESNGNHTENEGSESESGNRSERICQQCSGSNCLRTTQEATQKCENDLDICVTVFEGQTVLAQGCWGQLSAEVRNKCDSDTQCLKCNENLCNTLASSSFECIQCDSNSDDNCRTNPNSLVPSRCNISRTTNEYCFVRQEGDRIIRGCSYTLEEQMSCYASDNCMICQPSQLSGCNNISLNKDDNDSGGSSENGSNGNDTGNGESENNTGGNGSDDGSSDGASTGDGSVNGSNDGQTDENNVDESGHEGSHNGSNGCSANILSGLILMHLIIGFLIIK